MAITALAVAAALANTAIRGSWEPLPGAIELGRVPVAAVPTDRAGLHLVGSRSIDLLTPSLADSSNARRTRTSDSTGPGRTAAVDGRPGATTTDSMPRTPSNHGESNDSDPTAPTLPRVTLPELTTPPVTLLPPETSPKVTAPPITLPQATLPSVTLPAPSVPTTLTLPELPQLPILDLGGPGSG